MSSRVNYSSGAPWEDMYGYSRAVRIGNLIEVSGTVAVDEAGAIVGEGDAYTQTTFVLKKIEAALVKAGASLKDVVRTRAYVTDIRQADAYGRAHGEAFGDIKPCTTMVEVKALIAPEYLVEIEVTAILTG
ncbi:MAG: endoribonuclease [Flaviaesturariibacter sp.]|nr:endoribonuclease [Flaviaesturariibacter sp.]